MLGGNVSIEVFELSDGGIVRFDTEKMTMEVSESGRFGDCGVFRFRTRRDFETALDLARKGYGPGQSNDVNL